MNKKIKKILFSFLITSLLLTTLSGCSKNVNTQSILGDVKTNMEQAQSMNYDVVLKIDTTQKYEEIKIPTSIEYDLNIDTTLKNSHIKGNIFTTVKDVNNKYEIEAYQFTENEANDLFYNKEGDWYKIEGNNEKKFNMDVLKSIYNANLQLLEQTTVINDKECYVIQGDLSGDIMKELVKTISGESTEIVLEEDDTINITLYIYKDLNYVAYLKLDMKNIAGNIVSNSEIETSILNYFIEITFNSYNESEVSLDENIRKNAKKKNAQTIIIQDSKEENVEIETTEQPVESTTEEPNIGITNEEEQEDPNVISNLSEDWNSFQFQYDGTVYRIPVSYSYLENTGYSLTESEKAKILDAEATESINISNGTNTILAKFKNNTSSPKTLYECDIISLDFDIYSLSSEELAKFMFCKKLTFSTNKDEIINSWGVPTSEHNGVALTILTYEEDENSIEIYLDPETNTIIEYKISAN